MRGREHDKRAALGNGALESLDDRLACGNAERAAHELELMHDGDDLQALKLADARQDRVFLFGLGAAVAQTIGVLFGIAKLQRILRHFRLRQCLIGAVVEQVGKACLCGHLHMEAGRGNDPLVFFQIFVEDHFAGFRALDPEIFRGIPAAQHGIDPRAYVIGNPVHVLYS